MLLHLGHLGSSSASITYMRHLGHPTSIMDVASGLEAYRGDSSRFLSDDTQELGGDVGDTVNDRLGDSTRGLLGILGGERFNLRSSLGPFLLLISS